MFTFMCLSRVNAYCTNMEYALVSLGMKLDKCHCVSHPDPPLLLAGLSTALHHWPTKFWLVNLIKICLISFLYPRPCVCKCLRSHLHEIGQVTSDHVHYD